MQAQIAMLGQFVRLIQIVLCVCFLVICICWSDAVSLTGLQESVTFAQHAIMESKVYRMFQLVQVTVDSTEAKIRRGDFDYTKPRDFEPFLLSLQSGLREIKSGLFDIYEIFLMFPDGGMILTSYNYNSINDNLTTVYFTAEKGYNDSFDVRCRSYFVAAMNYTFDGRTDGTLNYLNETSLPLNTAECERARKIYQDIFFNSSQEQSRDIVPDVAWTKLVLQEYVRICARVRLYIYIYKNNEWIGAVTIFFFAEDIGHYLGMNSLGVETTRRGKHPNSTSWVFENDVSNYMVASSDGPIFNPQTEQGIGTYLGLEEFTTFSNLYWSTNYPNRYISIASEEIIQVHGIDQLPVNSNSSLKTISLPLDFPQLTASRIRYYDTHIDQESVFFYYNLDWIVCSLMSLPSMTVHFSDQMVMLITMALMAVFFTVLSEHIRNKAKQKEDEHYQKVERSYEDIKRDVQRIVLNACNAVWKEEMQQKELREGIALATTMSQAKFFLSNRAVQHMELQDRDHGKMFMFEKCQMETNNDWFHVKFVETFSHNWYDALVTFVIALHILLACWEPSTPSQLQQHGLKHWIVAVSIFCIVIEILDLAVQFFIRYFRFKSHHTKNGDQQTTSQILQDLQKLSLSGFDGYRPMFWFKYHENHVIRALIGPGELRFLIHGLLVVLVLLSFICAVSIRVSPFSYYVPVHPLLLVVRNTQLFNALFDVSRGIAKARDVLFLGFCMVFVTSALGMDLFAGTLNEGQSYDNFEQDISTLNLLFFLVVLLISLYAFLPMTINRFEASFKAARAATQHKREQKRVNALISAF
ncbi:hypothetical protein RFI_03408, partial [Reticulomyxa filosa]